MTHAKRKKSNWNLVVNLILLVLVIVWSIPIIGLFISSIRPQDNVLSTGWWTVFGEHSELSLDNYRQVLGGSQYTFVD